MLTGATGFLGSHLIPALLEAGYSVKALRRNSPQAPSADGGDKRISWHTIDPADQAGFTGFFSDVDCVIHTAASYGRRGEHTADVARANTLFGLQVLEAAVAEKVKCFMNTDSALPKMSNPYSISKAHFSEWGKYFSETRDIRFVNIRLEHMYGPGDTSLKFTNHVIDSCLNNVPQLKLSDGIQLRDFIFIDDVVSAYLTVLKNQSLFAPKFCEIPVGSGTVVSIRFLVESIHQLCGSATTLAFGEIEKNDRDVLYSCADISFLGHLGWHPETSLLDGLHAIITQKKAEMTDKAKGGVP